MKNLKLFKKENLEKFKIAGSIIGTITLMSISSCKVIKVENNNSSHNIQTNEIIGSIISESTPNTVDNEVPETISTTTPSIESIPETIPITIQTTTTQVPETTIITTPITTTTIATPEPIISTTISTTTSQITTTKPIETKPITTTQTTTVTTTPVVQTTPVETPPIEYNTRTEEIKAYYKFEYNDVNTLTKDNINNYNDFLNVADNFHWKTSTYSDEYGLVMQLYTVYYNLDTNSRDKYKTNSYIEKIVFLSLLNEEYINDETFKKILGIYTYDELKGLNRNAISVINKDMHYERYYDYSKIVINKNLRTLLTNIQNAYKEKDYVTLEKLCNENFEKYNTMVDSILLIYIESTNEINNYPTEETAFELAQKAIDDMGIYDRLHPKTLVLQ